MKKWRIYAGLGGGFGGANDCGVYEFRNKEKALDFAYTEALSIYTSYEGSHGILSWKECKEDLIDSYPDIEVDDEMVDNYYCEQVESWIDYYVEPEGEDT